MAVGNIKGFYVYDEENDESGIAHLATDAYADSSVTTPKVANKAINRQKLSDDVQAELNVANPASWMVKDDDYVNALYSEDDDVNYPIAASVAIDGLAETLDHKADQDGDYDDLTAGGAKQLLSTVYVDDNEPYNFRTAGGSADIGDRMYEEVVGGSIVWNQMVQNGNFVNDSGWTFPIETASHSVSNNICTFTAATISGNINRPLSTLYPHKYLVSADMKLTTGTTNIRLQLRDNDSVGVVDAAFSKDTTDWQTVANVVSLVGNSSNPYIRILDARSEGWDAIQIKNVVLYDLTQMFGSVIADYIYNLERGTAGAGVAWFRKLFPKPYYAYNVGELMSVKVGSHDTVGFNAWDEEWEDGGYNITTGEKASGNNQIRSKNLIPVVPNMTYYFGTASNYWFWVNFFDANKNVVAPPAGYTANGNAITRRNSTITMPSNCCYICFYMSTGYGTTYKNDICINLAWDGEHNGEYEPYEKHEYPLENLELRGIPKLDANNQLYYDGDTYASDGTVTRKYGVVDLGTLTWTSQTHATFGEYFKASVTSLGIKYLGTYSEVVHNILTSKYVTTRRYSPVFVDKTICADGGADSVTELQLKDSAFSDGTALKSALNGVYMVYELANPTTATADAFTNPQIVDDFGTEEYVDYAYEAGDRDVAIPVGHNSRYMNNLRAKLEMAPDSPDGNGDYIVRQNNGENSYVPYTADGRLTALEAKVPAPPSTNGTYKLTATVTDGGVTYTWTAG